MKRKSIFLTFGLLVLSWIGCVENDLPYPTIVGQITEMEVAGMTSCRILGASNMVEIKVADTIDLRDLRVEKLVVTEGMKVYPDSAPVSISLISRIPVLFRLTVCLPVWIHG